MTNFVLLVSCLGFLCQCVAVTRTPPLSGNGLDGKTYGGAAFSSGRFLREHDRVGIIQMTQEGYRTTFFGELNQGQTNPDQILRNVGRYVKAQGADGIQHFSLRLDNPQSKEEDQANKVLGALQVVAAIAKGDHGSASSKMSEGETTRYFVKGELVRWKKAEENPVKTNTSTSSVNPNGSNSSEDTKQ